MFTHSISFGYEYHHAHVIVVMNLYKEVRGNEHPSLDYFFLLHWGGGKMELGTLCLR